jgi:hypothetical protein
MFEFMMFVFPVLLLLLAVAGFTAAKSRNW